jgi:hypothetical protein
MMPTPHSAVHPSPLPPQHAGTSLAGHVPAQNQNITGAADGLFYKIDHRDSNSILSVMLQPNGVIKSKPGAMVSMSGTVQIKGLSSKLSTLDIFLTITMFRVLQEENIVHLSSYWWRALRVVFHWSWRSPACS